LKDKEELPRLPEKQTQDACSAYSGSNTSRYFVEKLICEFMDNRLAMK